MSDQGWYGTGGGMGPVAPGEGRFGDGGWLTDPMLVGPQDGRGVWAAPIGAHPEMDFSPQPVGEHPGDFIMIEVEGWDARYMNPRRPPFAG